MKAEEPQPYRAVLRFKRVRYLLGGSNGDISRPAKMADWYALAAAIGSDAEEADGGNADDDGGWAGGGDGDNAAFAAAPHSDRRGQRRTGRRGGQRNRNRRSRGTVAEGARAAATASADAAAAAAAAAAAQAAAVADTAAFRATLQSVADNVQLIRADAATATAAAGLSQKAVLESLQKLEDRIIAGRVCMEERIGRLETAVLALTAALSGTHRGGRSSQRRRVSSGGGAGDESDGSYSSDGRGEASNRYRDEAVGMKRGRHTDVASASAAGWSSGSIGSASAPASGTICVTVHSSTHGLFTLDVLPSKTIAAVKTMIRDSNGTPVEEQRLMLAGVELGDGRTLAECGVAHMSLLDMDIRRAAAAVAPPAPPAPPTPAPPVPAPLAPVSSAVAAQYAPLPSVPQAQAAGKARRWRGWRGRRQR